MILKHSSLYNNMYMVGIICVSFPETLDILIKCNRYAFLAYYLLKHLVMISKKECHGRKTFILTFDQ